MHASMKVLIRILWIILIIGIVVSVPQDTNSGIGLQADDHEALRADVLTEMINPLQQTGNQLYYGELFIELPDGVNAELQDRGAEDQQVGDVVDLQGLGDGLLAPRLWMTYYRAEDSDKWMIMSALMDLLPDTTLRFRCYDPTEDVGLFTYTHGYKNGYILTCEEFICVVEELSCQSDYVFGRFMDDGAVGWKKY